ncbi:DUF1614 domain-containing protein, partial [Candidatus Bathyarchaeota archaeon]|nr:DUF1614 domain-containing protein [Candidatus Bathyarchaeota archaeon]
MSSGDRVVFRPFSLFYFSVLLFLLLLVFPVLMGFYRSIMVEALGLPPWFFGAILVLSLFGSSVNIPLTTLESREPVRVFRKVRFFGVTWRVPRVEMGVRRTFVMLNLGGGVVPVLISGYLLGFGIPRCSRNLMGSYMNVLLVFLLVTFSTYRSSRLVKGLGIATPMFGPPLMTALFVSFLALFRGVSCPSQVAYVGGTLGALVGADLLNLRRIPDLGAPVVSIGGAGTFDGIYLTGVISVVL